MSHKHALLPSIVEKEEKVENKRQSFPRVSMREESEERFWKEKKEEGREKNKLFTRIMTNGDNKLYHSILF